MCKTFKNFLGKCDVTNMIIKLGKLDKSFFSGNTVLLEISEENKKYRYVFVGANKIYSFITNDHIVEVISNLGDNMIPFSIAIGEENIYFLSSHCKCIKRAKIKDNELLKTNGKSIDPFNYYLEKHGPNRFENLLEFTCIHSS